MNKKFENKTLMYQYDKELASGFQIDCEDFLNEFEKYQSFNFSYFQEVWHEKAFTYVFAGQTYALLLRDFCDNCFWVVKKYIMFPRDMFTQIGAFYLLYGLYYKQPLRGWIKIRVTLEEYHKLHELILEMKNRNQLDAVYIFSKMRADEAFLHVAQRKQLGPEDRFVKGVELFINDTFTGSKTQSSLIKFQKLPKTDIFTNLENTTKEYSELMKKFTEKIPSIPPFSSKLMEEIKRVYDDFNKETPNPQTPSEYTKESKTIQATRRAIRAKALANKNAIYRANRKVKIAADESPSEYSSDSFDSNYNSEPSTSTQKTKNVEKGKMLTKKNVGTTSRNGKADVKCSLDSSVSDTD